MHEALDPYTPGAGRAPALLVGRDAHLEALNVLITRAACGLSPARPLLLMGLQGVGKTVLLNKMVDRARGDGWMTVKIEAAQGRGGVQRTQQALAAGMAKAALALETSGSGMTAKLQSYLSSIRSFSLSVGLTSLSLGVEHNPRRASTGSLDLDLQDVVADAAELLVERGIALAVFVDEMQDLDDDLLSALISTQHEAAQQGWSFYVIGAGLLGLPGRLARTRSYAERMFEARQIGPLSDADARRVLVEPAEAMGATWEDAAVERIVTASGRYPYFLQEFGSAMWRVAERSPFTADDAEEAVRAGLEQLDSMFFSSRWDRATPSEREYLAAMAVDGGGASSSAEVAARLGKQAQALGPARANLISKGLVWSPERGRIAFTVPGFSEFIGRRMTGDY